jgi:pimeloyl-ACP methyl ester carboxylesterase
MADVTYSSSIATEDGYEREYSVYYATENGAAPLVCIMGGSGTAKGDSTLTDKMETLRDDGFTCLLMESRGHGAGITWMDANSFTEADYGWTYYSTLEIADIAQIIADVRADATHGAYVDSEKLAWLGRSQGAVLGYMLTACAGKNLQGIRVPKVNVLCVEAFNPDYIEAFVPKNLSTKQKSGRQPTGFAWGVYESLPYYVYTPNIDAIKTDLLAEDSDGVVETLTYGIPGAPRWEVPMRAGQHIDKDVAVHFGMSYDDRWGPTNPVLRFMKDHPKSYLWVGAADHHGATDVLAQNNQIQLQRQGILAHYLLGGTTLTNFGFDSDDIDSMSRITMAIVPKWM